MTLLGEFSLWLALLVGSWCTVIAFSGRWRHRPQLARTVTRSTHAVFVALAAATLSLWVGLISHDFNIEYVAAYTSRNLPSYYIVSALWAGQKGSLLFWAVVLALFGSLAQGLTPRRYASLLPYVAGVTSAVVVFFVSVMLFAASPFERMAFTPPDGRGLNPQLQNIGMVVHPPMLYLGYISITIPFAFAVAALMSRRLDTGWIHAIRRWTLVSWLFLSIGITLGMWWAYVELGWGGYWAWDPVENASLLPWLTMTAFLHSVMIQEKRGMLKRWNLGLIVGTFLLSIFGTFITRSGVIASVHSFTQSNVGYFFLAFLVVAAVLSFTLLYTRWPQLEADVQLESMLSREAAFLFNNLLFVGIAFSVLWGTLFPILSEWVRGTRITVSRVWFETFAVPLGLALLLLTGLGPLLAWKRSPLGPLGRRFRVPVAIAALVAATLAAAGLRAPLATAALAFCAFVAACTLLEFAHGTRLRMRGHGEAVLPAFVRVIDANKRRYGGFVVHMGMVLIFAGITASSAWQVEATSTLARGESFSIGPYRLTFRDLTFTTDARAETHTATVGVERDGRAQGDLRPAREVFPSFRNQPATEVDILHTLSEDLYVVLVRATEDGRATLKAYVNPLVSWIWIGGGVLLLGGLVTLLPDGRPRRAAVATAAGVGRAAA